MKLIFMLILSGVFATKSYSQALMPEQKLKWYTLQEAEKLNQVQPKKFMIDVYTDWCGWCKRMDESTFSHPLISKILIENYYPVKFNAETKDTIQFNGGEYINLGKTGRSTHPLAVSMLGWHMSYPTIVYFTEKLEFLGPMPGYKTPDQLEVILQFIAQEKFRSMDMETFQKTFVGQIPK